MVEAADDRSTSPKTRLILAGVGLALLGASFVAGYLLQGNATGEARAALADSSSALGQVRHDFSGMRLITRVGAALAEVERANYERGRQLISSFYEELDRYAPTLTDAGARTAFDRAAAQRDEIITLLSRAEPEAKQRLALMYTLLFSAADPYGRDRPGAVTPPSPPGAGAADASR